MYFTSRPRTDFNEGVGEPISDEEKIGGIQGTRYEVSKTDLKLFSAYEYKVSASTKSGEGPTATFARYCYTAPGGKCKNITTGLKCDKCDVICENPPHGENFVILKF